MKRRKIKMFPFLVLSILSGIVCCQQKTADISKKAARSDNFWGDSALGKNNYFQTIASEKAFPTLEKQNEVYLQNFSSVNAKDIKSTYFKYVLLKLSKQHTNDTENIKVNLYTYRKGKKIDSLDFYRNISGSGFGEYICMSYFDKKKDKIWQIKYFPSKKNEPSSIISYSESSILSDGKIGLDSIHYLDESLDVKMDHYNLYY